MTITKSKEGGKVVISIEGRLDTMTSPEAQEAIIPAFQEAPDVIVDLGKTIYVSSAGLRVILAAQKKAAGVGGSLLIRSVPEQVMEVFEMSGLKSVLKFI